LPTIHNDNQERANPHAASTPERHAHPMPRARKLAGAALTALLVTTGGIGATVLSAGAAHAATCPTASQIVTDINAIASQAGGITSQLGTLTSNSSPSSIQSVAQSTTAGLDTMSGRLAAGTDALNGCPALGSADSKTVANAFDGLANNTNQMLSALIGKHPVFAQFGLTAPITNSLRNLEGTLDTYTFALISVVPSQQNAVTNDRDSVGTSLDNAITVYQQLCIPSPLYPNLQPICIAL
jgi:Hydrophobic surface binding protein A